MSGRSQQQQHQRRRQWTLLLAALLLAGCGCAAVAAAGDKDSSSSSGGGGDAGGGYEYDYAYDGYYGAGDDAAGYDGDAYDDAYGYYGDDDAAYYDDYGYYADGDGLGYDLGYADYYDAYYDDDDYSAADGAAGAKAGAEGECVVGADGKVSLRGANSTDASKKPALQLCDIKVSGVDKQADKLRGGLDGVYAVTGCRDGRPYYKRKDSPAGEDRVLWYSRGFGDWDVSRGVAPTDRDILLYGGDVQHHAVPLFVEAWHLGGDLKTNSGVGEDAYVAIPNVKLSCADGTKVAPPKVNPAVQRPRPVLTDEEVEAKYRLVYERYGRRPDPSPALNFGFVVLLVMVGLTVVLAMPYMLLTRSGGSGAASRSTKGYSAVSTSSGGNGGGGAPASLAQVIAASRKKRSGHAH